MKNCYKSLPKRQTNPIENGQRKWRSNSIRGKQNGQLAYEEMLNFIGGQGNGYQNNNEALCYRWKLKSDNINIEENVEKWEFSTMGNNVN